MLSDLVHVNWQRRTEPEELPEWMDEPCAPEELAACLRDLGAVNRLSGGYRPTLRFLDRLAARGGWHGPLRILDVGSGGGDGLARVARWARRRGVEVELTGIDLNPEATRTAQRRYGDGSIRWVTGDALRQRSAADVVISSLLTHHLPTAEVVGLLRWMEETATVGWFVNDLERSRRSAALFALLARGMRWHRFVRHDGPVSFARSFVREDWERMLVDAGVPEGAAEIAKGFPSRLCVGRVR